MMMSCLADWWLPRYPGSSGTGQEQEEQPHAPGYAGFSKINVVMCMQARALGRKVMLMWALSLLFEWGWWWRSRCDTSGAHTCCHSYLGLCPHPRACELEDSPGSQVLPGPVCCLSVTAWCWHDWHTENPSSSSSRHPSEGLHHREPFPEPSAPLCLSPARPAQTKKPGLKPVTAVGPQGLFDLPLADRQWSNFYKHKTSVYIF